MTERMDDETFEERFRAWNANNHLKIEARRARAAESTLLAENARLREALDPFAEYVRRAHEARHWRDEVRIHADITIGDMRRAEAALHPAPRAAAKAPKKAKGCAVDSVPAPGEVGIDYRACCPQCGKRVPVTASGRYARHTSKRAGRGGGR